MGDILDEYIGGVNGHDDHMVITYMGGSITRVINDTVEYKTTEKILRYRYVDRSDMKEIIHIVALSVPVSFNKKIYYSDGVDDYDGKRTPIMYVKIIKLLCGVLSKDVQNIVNDRVVEYKLTKCIDMACVELLLYLANVYNIDKNCKKIHVGYNVMNIVNEYSSDNASFRIFKPVAINGDNVPNTMYDACMRVLYLCMTRKLYKNKSGSFDTSLFNPVLIPVLDQTTIDECKSISHVVKNTDPTIYIYDMVGAIIQIDVKISKHMADLEVYYSTYAKNIQKIHSGLIGYFKSDD